MSFNSREEEGASCSADVHKSSKFDSVDSSQEWRSWDQLEASPPSTSPPWDSDDDDESGPSVSGPRPSDLYGKFTWKIEKFSQINKRELRSNVFEVGGYKWYILVYPQGCDVCNHLSLFLCVADYDKLLPGWSHFAQFTIAVVNKDPKKSKYSDTLHRFCKKEHDWGWKKFMELSKVLDGFTVADTLVIKAQVQVIRENPHRPFRCLDCQYRRELVRVYLTNVEGICRRFVEEKREKIGKLMEDTVRWSSFRAFWSAVEENVRRRLSREKVDTILKAVVKFFFNEKEVTSTLVMDALYSGCKALDYRSKNKKGKINGVEVEETVNPVVWVDKDAFVLAGDVLLLLERAANEFLPPYKDDKGPQNRTKDGGPGDDFGKDSVERDERRLTELGRRTVEMFVLAHLFSSHVEVAYQEAIALKRQEELIREEEAAGQAEIEIKAKREAAEKEKRTKKKQAKQRRSNRKEKEKEVEEKRLVALQQEPRQREDSTCGRPTSSCLLKETSITSVDIGDEDDDLSVLDTNDDIVGTLGPAVEDGDADRALCEREVSEMHQMMEASFSGGSCVDSAQNKRSNWKHQLHVDDSSSACSSDSIPSINAASNGSTRRRSIVQDQNHNLHRRRDRVDNEACDKDSRLAERDGMLRGRLGSAGTGEASSSCNSGGLDAETIIESLKKRIQWLQQRLLEKEEEVVMLHEKLSLYQHHFGSDIGILDKQFFEPGDSYQKAEAPDPRPPSPLSRKKGEVPENQGKCVDEPQDLDRVAVKDATLTNGSAVSSNVINGASQSSNFVDVNSGGHINHNQSMADVQTLPATSHSHGYGLSLSEVSALNTPIAFVPVNFLSENSVPPSTSHSGLSTGSTTEMELSRPSSAPGLVAPSGSFPSPPLPHPPSSLVRSISTTERLGIGSLELATSNCPARQQSPPITHRNAAAGVIRNNNPTVHTGPFVSTVSAAGIRTHGSAGGYPYLSSGYSHHPISAPSGLGDVSPSASSIHTRKMSPVVCRQGVPGATNSVKDETTMAVGTNFLGTEDQVEGMYIVDAMENVLTQRAERGQHSMGFTFGTVTPEMLHLQHQQDQQRECVNASLPHTELDVPKEDFYQDLQFRHQSGERHNGKEPQKSIQNHGHLHGAQKYNFMLHHGLSQNVSGQRGGTRQNVQSVADSTTSGATMSEEFPHLDIINDLLDDDKIFGAKALNAFLQQSGNQGYHQHLSLHDLHDLHRICSAQVHPEFISVHGNGSERSDRGIPCEDGSHAIPGSSERAHNSLRESLQFRPYTHPPLSRSFSPHGGSVDGISGHHWPGSLGDLPVTSGANGVRSGVDVFVGYPMQNSHISIPDCPPFTLGQNGYTMYSPIKHP